MSLAGGKTYVCGIKSESCEEVKLMSSFQPTTPTFQMD